MLRERPSSFRMAERKKSTICKVFSVRLPFSELGSECLCFATTVEELEFRAMAPGKACKENIKLLIWSHGSDLETPAL